ncbi:YlxR family protein [Gulosibacter chungangensis]|uniref:YlxR family protein n=1 Tax=Gulosibacter chungangensis TaxID=979746 RepID=A0A7J5BBT4_9MICO|nr:YlxR family protein [Gulosibacter chungangensis]KAB1643600.1 YlxR family protein [Gulosibacter chungangensis]
MGQVRTCISCRSQAPRSELTRIVVSEGRLLVDREACQSGRGAWLHPKLECVHNALERRAFRRALRIRDVDDTEVRKYAEQLAEATASAQTAKVVDRTMDQS